MIHLRLFTNPLLVFILHKELVQFLSLDCILFDNNRGKTIQIQYREAAPGAVDSHCNRRHSDCRRRLYLPSSSDQLYLLTD